VKEIIRQKIEVAMRKMFVKKDELTLSHLISKIGVERTKDESFGDYTSNIAMVANRVAAAALRSHVYELTWVVDSKNPEKYPTPYEIATEIKKYLDEDTGGAIERVEVAGPGFLNFFLSPRYFEGVIGEVLAKGSHFGDSEIGAGKKVNNEFISANPTGPLHLGNGRGGFYGDTLSRILRKAGYDVTSEYYVNDAGEQVLKLGHSVLKDPETVYAGDYIDQLAVNNEQRTVRETGEWAADYILKNYIKTTTKDGMGIAFDSWISEKRDIVEAGFVDRALATLREKSFTFESEGALWLKTTDFGDDKDRVLVKSDGTRTYFASDCGYLLSKMERGYSRLILTLGADHHGYRVRLEAAAKALGFTGRFDFIFVQLVRLMKDGVEVRMSKRAGNVVTIDELIETVGRDVTRFFFLMYSPDTHMNFDLGLAEERSAKNPVYYVQYAHARLASILRKAEEAGMSPKDAHLSLLTHPKERELLRELSSFPELVSEIAETYAVHRLPQYAIRIADKLHSFYDGCRVIDMENVELAKARLALVSGVKIVLRETLGLLGIDAPERMETGKDA
jgi:arginyl-tRNA synthetase